MGTRWNLLHGAGAVVAMMILTATVARACGDGRQRATGPALAAVSDDPAVARAAISELRAMGPGGLQLLMGPYARLAKVRPGTDPTRRMAAAIDAVAAQKDAAYSGL